MTLADANDAALDDAAANTVTVIRSGGRGFVETFGEALRFHELLYFFVKRDISVKYRQAALGVSWIVIQPLVSTLIFTIIFNKLARITSGDVPYPLFVLSGLIPWMYFSASVGRASESLVANAGVIGKVYFPRILVPLSASLSGTLDFAIGFVALGGVMAWYGYVPGASILAVPIAAIYTIVFASTVGLFFSALNAKYRDVRFVLSFLMQIWLYLTPVVYPLSMIPERYRFLAAFNPMTGAVEAFRWSILGGDFPKIEAAVSAAICALLFVVAQAYFRATERTLVDVI